MKLFILVRILFAIYMSFKGDDLLTNIFMYTSTCLYMYICMYVVLVSDICIQCFSNLRLQSRCTLMLKWMCLQWQTSVHIYIYAYVYVCVRKCTFMGASFNCICIYFYNNRNNPTLPLTPLHKGMLFHPTKLVVLPVSLSPTGKTGTSLTLHECECVHGEECAI